MSLVSTDPAIIRDFKTADFDYELPAYLIAQTPLERRDASRLLVLDRKPGTIAHSTFDRLGSWLSEGDLLVANNSRVIPARLRGRRKPNNGAVELLLLRQEGDAWSALAKPAKRLTPGTRLEFPSRESGSPSAVATIEENRGEGEVLVRFSLADGLRPEDYGVAPLPPYISQQLADEERYQTVYGTIAGSAAAPTAGLHFTHDLIKHLAALGVAWTEVTLHVGLDTFRPVTAERIADHHIHREWCEVSRKAVDAIAECRRRRGRVVAVGTTAARTLETLGRSWSEVTPRELRGLTQEFIVPGHEWRLVDALLTNFHLPRSTLLMLVSAFAGREATLGAYKEAIEQKYRFYSFGDAMLIL